MVIADVSPVLQLFVAQPVEADAAGTFASQKLRDISFNTEPWFLDTSVTEGQLYFWIQTAPASREAREIIGFSGMLRVCGDNLLALDQIHELSINRSNDLVEILAAPKAYAQLISGIILRPPDAFFTLPIWGSGLQTMSPRSMFSADVQQASDRALALLAREHAYGEALTEDEVAELMTLLSGTAGRLVGPAPFDKTTKLSF